MLLFVIVSHWYMPHCCRSLSHSHISAVLSPNMSHCRFTLKALKSLLLWSGDGKVCHCCENGLCSAYRFDCTDSPCSGPTVAQLVAYKSADSQPFKSYNSTYPCVLLKLPQTILLVLWHLPLIFTGLKYHFPSSWLNTQCCIKYLFNFFLHHFLFYSPLLPLYCSTLSEMLSGAF